MIENKEGGTTSASKGKREAADCTSSCDSGESKTAADWINSLAKQITTVGAMIFAQRQLKVLWEQKRRFAWQS